MLSFEQTKRAVTDIAKLNSWPEVEAYMQRMFEVETGPRVAGTLVGALQKHPEALNHLPADEQIKVLNFLPKRSLTPELQKKLPIVSRLLTYPTLARILSWS